MQSGKSANKSAERFFGGVFQLLLAPPRLVKKGGGSFCGWCKVKPKEPIQSPLLRTQFNTRLRGWRISEGVSRWRPCNPSLLVFMLAGWRRVASRIVNKMAVKNISSWRSTWTVLVCCRAHRVCPPIQLLLPPDSINHLFPPLKPRSLFWQLSELHSSCSLLSCGALAANAQKPTRDKRAGGRPRGGTDLRWWSFFFIIIPLTYNAGVFQSMHQDCLIFRAGLWVSLWDCAARLGSVQFHPCL